MEGEVGRGLASCSEEDVKPDAQETHRRVIRAHSLQPSGSIRYERLILSTSRVQVPSLLPTTSPSGSPTRVPSLLPTTYPTTVSRDVSPYPQSEVPRHFGAMGDQCRPLQDPQSPNLTHASLDPPSHPPLTLTRALS